MSSNNIVCVQMFNAKTDRLEWYLIKVSVPSDLEQKFIEQVREIEKNEEGKIMQLYGMKPVLYHSHDEKSDVSYPRVSLGQAFASADSSESPGFAVLGSCLYFVGGSVDVSIPGFRLRPHSKKRRLSSSIDIQCCEFSVSDLSIKSVNHFCGMKSPRSEPMVLVLDNKLYILGGLDESAGEKGPWIEVFNTVLKKWNDIPDPPVKDPMGSLYCFDGHACAVLEHSKEIFLATDDEICFFSIEKNTWHRIIWNEKGIEAWGQGMTIGQTLYWFEPKNIMLFAYSLQTGEWRRDCVMALSSALVDCNAQMVRAGGDSLYLLWTSDSHIHCFRFKVSFVLDDIPFADAQCCILTEIPETISLMSCWFVGEESAFGGTSS